MTWENILKRDFKNIDDELKTLQREIDGFQESINHVGRLLSQIVKGTTFDKLSPRQKETYKGLVKLSNMAKEGLDNAKGALGEAIQSMADLTGRKNTVQSAKDFVDANM